MRAALCTVLVFAAMASADVPVPSHLPRYTLDLTLDPDAGLARFRQEVTWTNPTDRPTTEVVFNFYPLYRVPASDRLLLAKTLELMRVNPADGLDRQGRHGTIGSVRVRSGDTLQSAPFRYREQIPTSVVVEVPRPVGPGERVTVELTGEVRLPSKQGRWGRWQGITFLTNALPVVAFYDAAGWHDVPFVPWHQPFWNEAGVYASTITLPADEVLACSAAVESEESIGGGRRRVTCQPFVGRDFAAVCSRRFREFTHPSVQPDGRTVLVKCLAEPRHEHYAREVARIAAEALPAFADWFGPFPYDQFTVAQSYFGWNGNECGGMVLIDERVFDAPHLMSGYVEYLVSHETCHQWWYNLVGTNGFSETVMDEGPATHFTHKLMDQKHGRNNPLLKWPSGLGWLPNIRRENYRFASLTGSHRRGDSPPAVGDLPSYGHLVGLFSGAYDRGSKVFGMIEARLGPEAKPFFREFVARHAFRVASVAGLKRELTAFTGPASAPQWDQLFDQWVTGGGLTDWKTDAVTVGTAGPRQRGRVPVEVVVSQHRQIEEVTPVGFQLADGDGFPVRVPVGPGVPAHPLPGSDATVENLGDGRYRVRLTLPSEPIQVAVDPDRVQLDAEPGDNAWRRPVSAKLVPLYTMLNETDLTNDYDRWNVAAGPWFSGSLYQDPWYTRGTMVGVRAGAFRTQRFAGGVYAAFRQDFNDLVVGADGLIDHWPGTHTQVGFNVERRVAGPWGGDGEDAAFRANLFGRYVFSYGSSLYLPPISYVDLFTTYADNFLPVARQPDPNGVRPAWTQLTGLHYRLNLYTPYWDPERGVWADLVAAGGATKLDGTVGTAQLRAELAAARRLPEEWGRFAHRFTFAGRVVGQTAWPDRGQFFALGGSTLFRGFDLRERQGSNLWVANAEVRTPLVEHARLTTLDNTLGVRTVSLAGFYDVGAVYTAGRSVGGVAHALGAGVRVDLSLFSFIERATLRLDVAKTINAARPVQVWFGVQQPF
jgi:hypothetical protein